MLSVFGILCRKINLNNGFFMKSHRPRSRNIIKIQSSMYDKEYHCLRKNDQIPMTLPLFLSQAFHLN